LLGWLSSQKVQRVGASSLIHEDGILLSNSNAKLDYPFAGRRDLAHHMMQRT
jgi:hypothetical protein